MQRNKSYKDRYQLIGKTFSGRRLKIICQLKPGNVVRIITGWQIWIELTIPPKSKLSDEEIDQIVESQAENNSAWEKPIPVTQQPISIVIPPPLAAKAKFLATLESKSDIQAWLIDVLQEQINVKFTAW